MAFTLDNVREASYREAVFIMETSNVSGGRKDVIHEFVNSDKQVVEDLGLKRRSYSVSATIHGINYERDKTALEAVLNDGVKGTLVHPFEGNIENMVVRTYTLRENFRQFGVATFDIEFAPSDDIGSPVRAFASVSEVATQRLVVMSAIEESMASLYETSADLTGSFENSVDKATSYINDFEEATRGFQGIASVVNSLSAQIIDFNLSVNSLVQNPLTLASSIDNLFITANNAYPNAVQTLGLMKNLFDFGEDDEEQLSISTAAILEINSNNDILNYSVNSAALANAYLQLSRADLNTVTEIEREESDLEDQYDLITNLTNLPRDIRTELTTLRSIASEVIATLKTTTPNLIDIEVVNKTAIRKLEYINYGDNTRTDTLISINQIQDLGFVNGTLEFLNDNS